MSSVSKGSAAGEPSGRGTRLDGWKEIATYLGRAERTVKRWEEHRGLPTHRIPGEGRRVVFAYSAELDEWLQSSEVEDEAESAENEMDPADSWAPASAENRHSETTAATLSGDANATKVSGDGRRFRGWATLASLAVAGLAVAALGLPGFRKPARHTAAARDSGNAPGASDTVAAASSSEQAVAHELYLKGRYEWNQRTPDSLNRAVDSFTQAIVHDPHDAEAYVGLAETYALLREYTTMQDSEAFSRSLAAAKKAVELNDSLAEAHRALAFAEMYGTWDFVDAEKEFQRAIDLDPRDPVARHWYANAFGVPGRFDECLRQMDIAQSLDPASHATLADKGWMLFLAGRRDEGVNTLKEVERSVPDFVSPHTYLMQIGLEIRDYPLFLEEGEKMAATKQDSGWLPLFAAGRKGYARGGERGLLQAMHDAARDLPSSYASSTTMAKICILMGRNDEALRILEEQYSRHDSNVLSCLSHPIFLTLRNEPRYEALVRRINFPALAGNGLPGVSPS
jgi:tetratricopeptide (TPR) repeat protein